MRRRFLDEVLKGKPARSDPPKPYAGTKLNQGRYLELRDGLVCLGEGPTPGEPACEDTCDGDVCISATDAITWGEAVAGAARGCRDVLGVYVGTGIGAGLIVVGQLVEGASNCAGELGDTKVRWDEDAAPCMCGGRGCVEAYVGGSCLLARIRRELASPPRGTTVLERAGGSLEAVTPGHVDAAALAGDAWAHALWTELATLLGVALGNALALLNSQRLVLGGGVLGRTPALRAITEAALTRMAPAASLEPLSIALAELGDDAGLVGAARLARDAVSIIA